MSESVDGLKQRLVGAFVILSLAIIFLPMIFDKPHREKSTAIELVPPKPQQRSVVISKPRKTDLPEVDENNRLERTVVPAASDDAGLVESADKAETNVSSSDGAASNAKDLSENSTAAPAPVSEAKPEAKPESRPEPTEVYNNVWMVQLGTFSKTDNAYRLRDQIREKGIDAHTKSIESGAVRVFAGPFVTKKEALRMKKKLDADFKLDSLVLFLDT
jgi:DedD protein